MKINEKIYSKAKNILHPNRLENYYHSCADANICPKCGKEDELWIVGFPPWKLTHQCRSCKFKFDTLKPIQYGDSHGAYGR